MHISARVPTRPSHLCRSLARTTRNVELARRQLRHANLQTTLQVYVEVTAEDELELIADMANPFDT